MPPVMQDGVLPRAECVTGGTRGHEHFCVMKKEKY